MEIQNDQYRLYVERLERLLEEKQGIADDVRDVYTEMKGQGYDAPITRQIIKLRKMSSDDRAEMDAILDTYRSAIGV